MMGQGTPYPPVITIWKDYPLEVVHQLTYLSSTATDNLSLNVELCKRIGKASTTLKIDVYKACVISTLLYGIES